MNHRDQLIDRAILAPLKACGDYLLPDASLFDEAGLRVSGEPLLRSEYDDRRRVLESKLLILGTQSTYGVKWCLTDAGRAFCAKERIT